LKKKWQAVYGAITIRIFEIFAFASNCKNGLLGSIPSPPNRPTSGRFISLALLVCLLPMVTKTFEKQNRNSGKRQKNTAAENGFLHPGGDF
jgi:hypothetical protein